MRTTNSLALLAVGLITALPGMAVASSFQVLEQSAARLGNGFAGTASAAEDATTVFFQPCRHGATRWPSVAVSGSLLRFGGEFEDGGGTQASGPEGDLDESEVVPALYYVAPLGRGTASASASIRHLAYPPVTRRIGAAAITLPIPA